MNLLAKSLLPLSFFFSSFSYAYGGVCACTNAASATEVKHLNQFVLKQQQEIERLKKEISVLRTFEQQRFNEKISKNHKTIDCRAWKNEQGIIEDKCIENVSNNGKKEIISISFKEQAKKMGYSKVYNHFLNPSFYNQEMFTIEVE